MTDTKNIAASVRQRLLNYAKAYGDDYQRTLTRYAIERLLYRLCQTPASENYILKGAMLFITWPERTFRPTGDLDLLGYGSPDPAAMTALFSDIAKVAFANDGILFDANTITADPVREDDRYQGARITLQAQLGTAIIPVQIDVGFGDNVFPAAERRAFPCLLEGLPAPEILMYPRETVVAEKFEAMVRFNEANSRLKDFNDIWIIIQTFEFDLATLVQAILGTFKQRGAPLPNELPFALTSAFAAMAEKQQMWSGFLRRNTPAIEPPPLETVLEHLRRFFAPVIAALPVPEAARGKWNNRSSAWEQA